MEKSLKDVFGKVAIQDFKLKKDQAEIKYPLLILGLAFLNLLVLAPALTMFQAWVLFAGLSLVAPSLGITFPMALIILVLFGFLSYKRTDNHFSDKETEEFGKHPIQSFIKNISTEFFRVGFTYLIVLGVGYFI